ncbi:MULTISPECIES: methionine ABC transporter permease [Janibacter]|uniref:ABC transporter permease n=1 Tax=Janibacter hoylei PVAS-1 TaxID=1210046 RepID=K1DVT2_9MICO|nr:methionine ABC transporter permease [Janibacter hoylei]EKA60635.1 ABC transporter permease [Janibacter hoylei PVAS-1]MCT1617731.1 ABC transporter permease [Janibacter hoylei]MCT2292400.1 ABC transporter permease [Janibacter hoylei]MCW4600614.1 ABC transporter permease [Janibacter hoylei]RWU81517.1 ABC transporter permease [Janibacter hoylei PVAS-1]
MSALTSLVGEGRYLDNEIIRQAVPTAIWETLAMTGVASALTALIGIPLGVLLFTSSPGGTAPNAVVHRVVGAVVNLGRSLPFLILMIAIIPFTRLVVGTSIGWQAAVVPLTVGAIPFYARLVETSLREVPGGKVEAVTMMGATRSEITRKVLLPEARSGLVAGLTTTVIALIGYTAMAGAVGGGGLGAVAMSYGYNRFESDVMIVCVALLVVIVTVVQVVGDLVARRLDRR